ncbi:MAG: hypothetical protein ACRDJM_11190 [Actinomycetota bacterium]
MRKIVFVLAAGVLAGSLGTGHAAGEYATCAGTTGLTGVPYGPTFAGACDKTFTVSAPVAVAINLLPSETFTGTLRARVTSRAGGGTPVTGTFVAGQLVSGLASAVAQLVPFDSTGAPIEWKLTVSAGDPVQVCSPYTQPPVSCAPAQAPTFGFGAFSGSVTPAPSETLAP